MTSAQNRLQLLNGNKYWLGIILSFCLFSSCVPKKKYVDTRPTTKTTKPKKEDNEPTQSQTKKVREIEWTFTDEKSKPPIGTKKSVNQDLRSSYNLALLLPLNASGTSGQQFIEKGTVENRFIQFYAGAKMAIEEYKGSSRINVQVFDSSKKSFESILDQSNFNDQDVIIGPYDKSKIKKAALYAESSRAVLISPWQASKKIAEKNAAYVQLKPNLEDHYYTIARDACTDYMPEQIYLIGRKGNQTDAARFKYFNSISKEKHGRALNEYLIIEDSLNFGETAFDSTLFDREAAFIIPNWKSADESFVYTCMRRLRVEKGIQKIRVYGMPIVGESDKINFDLYLNLDAHVAQSRFFDKSNNTIKAFRRNYFNKYNVLPGKDACEGYDIMKYTLNNLDANGKNFQFFLDQDINNYLLTKFNVERYLVDPEEDANDLKNIEYFLNNHVQLLHFKSGNFKVKP